LTVQGADREAEVLERQRPITVEWSPGSLVRLGSHLVGVVEEKPPVAGAQGLFEGAQHDGAQLGQPSRRTVEG